MSASVALGGSVTGTGSARRIAFRVRRDLQVQVRESSALRVQPVRDSDETHHHATLVRSQAAPAGTLRQKAHAQFHPFAAARKYLFAALALSTLGVGLIFEGNRSFNALMYDENGMLPAAQAFARGKNYANFDLNINIRKLRDLHIARMTETPDLVLLGASHWQEAHNNLLPGYKWYNSHIHREFWQDLFAMVNMWESHGRLPKKMIIALRDNIFAPISSRPDYLWEPGIPYWRDMADKMGIQKEPWWQSYPWHRFREKFSLSMLYGNIARWANAEEQPQETTKDTFESLDVLLPDGSVKWSTEHMKIFTPDRTLNESLTFANYKIAHPPMIEQQGVENVDKLLTYLESKGVAVTFARPPYNPQFWDKVQGTAYMDGLKPVLDVQNQLAAKHGIKIIGSFDPREVGCVPEEYIDSEHANPTCLKHIFDQFAKIDHQGAR